MSDQDERQLEAMLEQALSAGIIRESDRDTYGFNHALTQQSLYADLPGRRKRRLHLSAGEALEKVPESKRQSSAAQLAWHFMEGDDPERALQYSLLAGEEAQAIGALAEARRQYRTAVGLARELDDESRLARGLFELGALLIKAQEDEEALALLNEAADLFRGQGDAVMQGRAIHKIAESAGLRGLSAESNVGLERVDSVLAEDPPTLRAVNPTSWIKQTDYVDQEFQPSLQVSVTTGSQET